MQQSDHNRSNRSAAEFAKVGFAGFLMGICEIIPGVSGGTMAFILGVYEELIQSIRDVTSPEFIQAVLRFRVKEVFEILNWQFLGVLGIGMVAAIFSLAEFIGRMLETRPSLIWSVFFGLVIASIFLVMRRISVWSPMLIALFLLVAVAIFFLFGGSGIQTPDVWWAYILSGAIAICAFILPGISGSFVLVLLGKYDAVLDAVRAFDILTIGLVGLGVVVGLVTFARVVGWLFERYHDIVVTVLAGLMLGSLRVIWPWKADPFCLSNHQTCTNIMPSGDSQTGLALGLMLAGIVAILIIERLSRSAE